MGISVLSNPDFNLGQTLDYLWDDFDIYLIYRHLLCLAREPKHAYYLHTLAVSPSRILLYCTV
jgi:hypothetical protein